MKHILAAIVCLVSMSVQAADKPNVIVIFTDDHGYSDLSCQDIQTDIKTPNIDRLANGGIRMTSGYASAPQCVPSRAGLLSGRYQNRFGVESNGLPLEGFNKQQTIAERLKTVGYATGMTGKWHLGPVPEIVDHGFDDVYYKNTNRPGWANFNLDGTDRKPGAEDCGLYHLDANSAAACAFINRHHNQPFFFYCAYRAPHVPLDAPKKYLDRFAGDMPERRRQALAMLSAVDDGVGKIVATLRQHGLEEKTLIFVIGDNGAPLKIHKLDAPGGGPGWDGSLNEPLNGEKGMLSEGGMRVPFVAAWKGQIRAGQTYDRPVISLDVAATTAALAGLPPDPQLDGINLMPLIQGTNGYQTPKARTLYWRWIAQAAIREGRWKYLKGGQREYLFDVVADREEKHNLLSVHPEIAKPLAAKLHKWSEELQPPGLATKAMSTTWEQYYDHYLDGKPVAWPFGTRKNGNGPMKDKGAAINGWLTRNCVAKQKDGVLAVRPNGNKKAKPFITVNRLKLPADATAVIRMRSKPGKAGIQWRGKTQKDFISPTVGFDVPETAGFQDLRVKLSATETIIHVRLLLPVAGADIKWIQFESTNGETIREWRFDKP